MPLDKAKIRQSFASASHSYDAAADLQRTVGYALLAKLQGDMSGTLLDIGCGTGFLTSLLARFQPETLIALDVAVPMLQATRGKLFGQYDVQPMLICADAEALPLASASVHQVFSSLALQWCSNLPAAFGHIKRVLKTDGQFIFSTFAPRTLQELKSAWSSVDDYSHVNDFYEAKQIEQFLRTAGFSDIHITQTLYIRHYDSVLALMQELKHIGAHNVRTERNKHCTSKSTMRRMITAYEAAYSEQGKIIASYDIFSVLAK